MDGRLTHGDMENATENPSKAAEYLKELNNIIETQQELLEKQKGRIEELEHQVHDLCEENACLKEQHQRHLATCRLQQLSSIKENVMQEKQKLRQALGGKVVLPDDWETTAEVIRETGRKVLGVSSGRRKEDEETWWNEEVQDSIQRKRLDKKKWDMDRTEENRQEYKELQRRVKREVSKAKQKAYDELYTRLDTREGEKDLYRVENAPGPETNAPNEPEATGTISHMLSSTSEPVLSCGSNVEMVCTCAVGKLHRNDKSTSALKVFVVAFAECHSTMDGISPGAHKFVATFLKGGEVSATISQDPYAGCPPCAGLRTSPYEPEPFCWFAELSRSDIRWVSPDFCIEKTESEALRVSNVRKYFGQISMRYLKANCEKAEDRSAKVSKIKKSTVEQMELGS
ncbi:hypothetical protein QTP70_004619 [Hemibagrus guttatus]|uniref:Uncharacterized protein n=1 Tax=Hemibagrus guttatus TaxID=175788 RepID=A0AAE0Q1L9_9TELE|nr:hypothetical protein QTP70_004619 [Hemibagrus guttatus]